MYLVRDTECLTKIFKGDHMLRFDVPQVWSNVTRFEAFLSFIVCILSLLFTPWLMAILVVQGFVRGFIGHYKCPMHCVSAAVFERFSWGGKKENAGAKMFANKILFVASLVSVISYAAGSEVWKIPCIAILVFATLEWLFSFCVACYAYSAWYRFKNE